jgi:hypothetical protein
MSKKKSIIKSEQSEQSGQVDRVEVPPKVISIKNNLNQLVSFSIKRPDGSMIGIQIDANSSVQWKKLPDYGPDVERLIKRKTLRLESGK